MADGDGERAASTSIRDVFRGVWGIPQATWCSEGEGDCESIIGRGRRSDSAILGPSRQEASVRATPRQIRRWLRNKKSRRNIGGSRARRRDTYQAMVIRGRIEVGLSILYSTVKRTTRSGRASGVRRSTGLTGPRALVWPGNQRMRGNHGSARDETFWG
ncbi:hypothetical protein BKA81DRAFT_351870 [Phyllosticta paracitricarpa]